MTRLRVVPPAPAGHSVRADLLTDETSADLEWAARVILAPARDAIAELADAIANRRHDLIVPCERRLLAVGLLAADHANALEKEPA